MATIKQKRAAKRILENPRTPIGAIMREVGYKPNTSIAPSDNLLNTKGFKDAMAEFGLTEELITTALVSDINEKPKHRFLELNLGAEILGMKDRDTFPKGTTVTNLTQIIINHPHGVANKPDTEAVSRVAGPSES